ncbi:MAG: hypothetical protein C4547_06465 [Phycisphaerales bacterium]|nr:MAG: hypothetical protein C4547_06465 [Phycisphaerales bacterium]
MKQFKLGWVEDAKASLTRLRELLGDTRNAASDEYQAFLAEAEALIEGAAGATGPTSDPANPPGGRP